MKAQKNFQDTLLANALLGAGRYVEAEQLARDCIARCLVQENHRLASVAAGNLFYLLMFTGRFDEALSLAMQKAEYTRRAKLGPWTQLRDEIGRLQVLNALGHHADVLAAVQNLYAQMTTLLSQGTEIEEATLPWSVQVALLDTGRSAALDLGQWETALRFSAEQLRLQQQRGSSDFELASRRFNDYFPLLKLRRYDEARTLLASCRLAYEQASDSAGLGRVFSALADLEHTEGHGEIAVRFQCVGLRYSYQAGHPEDCAMGHNNLANYLAQVGALPEVILAHRLVAVTISFQTSSGDLARHLRNLANASLPAPPPSFAAVAATVEQVEGVRFRDLFGRLPARAPDGDAAIATVWKLAQDMTANRQD